MIDTVLSFLAPHYCYGCGQIGRTVCDNCKYDITSEQFSGCIGCVGLALKQGICGRCRLPYARAWVVDTYKGPLGEVMKGMKIVSMREAAQVLGEILASTLPSLPPNAVIVPIPTVRSHVRQRGFDHTGVIAGVVATRHGVPMTKVLRRIGTSAQRGASARQRRAQAKEAFAIEIDVDPDAIYVVIDDVVTTSATIREAGFALRRAGATEIWVAALTRETLD